MNKIKQDYLLNDSVEKISATYIPTVKNIPVSDFYGVEGFDMVKDESSQAKKYVISKQHAQLRKCAGMTIRSI